MNKSDQPAANEKSPPDELSLTISAWMDGDEVLIDAHALDTAAGIEQWQIYHLIGDTLRTAELAIPTSVSLSQRIHAAVAAEPSIIASPRPTAKPLEQASAAGASKASHWMHRYGWSGLAMAAAVASVVWVARPFLVQETGGVASQIASVPTPASVVASNADVPAVQAYVTAHRQLSGPTAVRQVSFGASR